MATTHQALYRPNRIKPLRRAAGITQADLGKLIEEQVPGWEIAGWRISVWERSQAWLPEIAEGALREVLGAPIFPPNPDFDDLADRGR